MELRNFHINRQTVPFCVWYQAIEEPTYSFILFKLKFLIKIISFEVFFKILFYCFILAISISKMYLKL